MGEDYSLYREDSIYDDFFFSNSDPEDAFQLKDLSFNNKLETLNNKSIKESSPERIINKALSKNFVSNKNENNNEFVGNRYIIDNFKNNKNKKEKMFKIEHQNGTIFHIKKSDDNSNDNTKEFSNMIQKNDKINKKRKRKALYERDNKHLFRIKAKKKKRRRRDDTDNIKNKILSGFFRFLKKNANEILKSIDCKAKFKNFPSIFSRHISSKLKEKNKNIKEIDITFNEIFQKEFVKINKDADIDNYEGNKKTLKYLDENQEICEKSKFNIIGKMTFSQLFKEYFNSSEYEKEKERILLKMNRKNEEKEKQEKYIQKYINITQKIVNYFNIE